MSDTGVAHVLAAESRSELLAALRAAGRPVSVADAAALLGLRPSTARFHLDLLVSAGLVARETERRGTAGRPRIRYVARDSSTPDATTSGSAAREADAAVPRGGVAEEAGYRRLARVLADQLSGLDDPARAAREAGHRWVEALDVPPGGEADLDPDAAVAEVAGLMDRLGFAPDRPAGGDRLLLRRCPFEAVARDHRAVVCGVHAGMLEQTFERLGGAVAMTELRPFASEDPLLCVVGLRRT